MYAFEEHARQAQCVGSLATVVKDRSPVFMPTARSPVTKQQCATLCEMQHDRCNYFHFSKNDTVCHMFVQCDVTIISTSFTVYKRKHHMQADGISQYTALSGAAQIPRSEAMLVLKVFVEV